MSADFIKTQGFAAAVAREGNRIYGTFNRTEWAYYDVRTKRYMNGSDYVARMIYVNGRNIVRFDRDRNNAVDVPWTEIPIR